MSGKSIEAVLRLNTEPFEGSLTKTRQAVNTFKNSMVNMGKESTTVERGITSIQRALSILLPYLNQFINLTQQTKTFNSFANGLKRMSEAVMNLSNVTKTSQVGMIRIREIINAWANAAKGLTVNIRGNVSAEQQETSTLNQLRSAYDSAYASHVKVSRGVQQYTSALEVALPTQRQMITMGMGIANSDRQEASAHNQNTSAIERETTAKNRNISATQKQTYANKMLGSSFSMLRGGLTMVGSMIAYNFIHKLGQATTETINAKSEMNGYFQMLKFGKSQIADFNAELDNVIQKFPRLNKYALGETISSIGVEFELTTQEMKKAMPVVSMITSEYLRAGRNVNEASLAVKDILQGEFQRLSRETGVKGDQLKEAGWSGDKSDVMGLLEALDKVGKSRNWDTFVMKANSLNDAVLIMQNRFGEWSADMVERIQPTIVGVFNVIMGVAQQFATILGGALDWLGQEGWGQEIVKWTGLATAIGLVTAALVSYRTGANLVQLVQMGLRGSITATIFSLKAEEVATYGSRNALLSKLTSIKAEQVAEMGSARAITTKLLGLRAESVASMGVKGAIMETVLARKMEEAAMRNASIQEKIAIASEHQSQVAKMGTLKTIFAKIAGVNMETFAEKGLIVALAERVASSPLYIGSLKAEEVAELSTAEAALVLTSAIAPLVAIFIAIGVAVYSAVKPLQDASEQMKAFNNVVDNSDSIMKESYATQAKYRDEVSRLEGELSKATQGSKEYKRIQDQLTTASNNYAIAQKNVETNIKAVNLAKDSKDFYDTKKIEYANDSTIKLADAYIKAGYSATEASEMASSYYRDAEAGAKQLYSALQRIKFEEDIRVKKTSSMIDYLKKYDVPKDEVKKIVGNINNARDKITEGFDKFMTSDDLMERVGGWFEIQQGRFEEWWTELNAFFEVRDWDSIGQKLQEGFKYIITGFGAYDWMTPLNEAIGEKGIVGVLMDALWGEGDSDGILDIAWDFLNNAILTPIADWLNWFLEDPISHFQDVTGDFSLAVAKFLFGKDESKSIAEMIEDWAKTNISDPINDWFANLPMNLLNFGGETSFNALSMVTKALFGEDSLEGYDDYGTFISKLTDWFWGGINAFIDSLTGGGDSETTGGATKSIDIGPILQSLLNFDSVSQFVQDNIITPLSDAFYNGIMNIPIVSTIFSLFGLADGDNTGASQKGSDIGKAFKSKFEEIIRGIPILGDILQILGIIPQANPTAKEKGKGVGDNVDKGYFDGTKNLVSNAVQEFKDIADGIAKKAVDGYNAAKEYAGQVWEGLNSVLKRQSPGFFHDQFQAEFGTDIPNAINDASAEVYAVGQNYATQLREGVSSANGDMGLGQMVDNYESDAQVVAQSSQMIGVNTTDAFNEMSLSVNQTTSEMQGNVVSSYSAMDTKQSTLLNNMKTKNTSAYNEMYLKSNQSLLQMRDSTSNITTQMTHAWNMMKDNIVKSATQLKNDSTVHFNQLSNTIGTFYGKIQNPSRWGAGSSRLTSSSARPSVGRSVARSVFHGAGPKYSGTSSMSIGALKNILCPNGDCSGIFDGYNATDIVDVAAFLRSIDGKHGFGWGDWNGSHYSHIKTKSDAWSTGSPVIRLQGGIPTSAKFKVGEFNRGSPKISFGEFQSMAGSIFSAIPYKHYMDSSWKGSWLGALQSGACNCSDGADALIAFANSCGFSGYKQWGTWDGEGHFWAVINGVPMDTTAWQKGYGWRSPKVHGYGPSNNTTKNNNVTVNVTISGDVYGVDDLDSKISEGVNKGLREHFNDPYTVAI